MTGPQKTDHPNTFSGGVIWKTRVSGSSLSMIDHRIFFWVDHLRKWSCIVIMLELLIVAPVFFVANWYLWIFVLQVQDMVFMFLSNPEALGDSRTWNASQLMLRHFCTSSDLAPRKWDENYRIGQPINSIPLRIPTPMGNSWMVLVFWISCFCFIWWPEKEIHQKKRCQEIWIFFWKVLLFLPIIMVQWKMAKKLWKATILLEIHPFLRKGI